MDVSSLKLHGWTRRGAEGRARETRLCLRAGKGALKAKSSADGMSGMSEIQIKVFKYTRLFYTRLSCSQAPRPLSALLPKTTLKPIVPVALPVLQSAFATTLVVAPS